MKKIIVVLLAILLITGCSKPVIDQPDPEPDDPPVYTLNELENISLKELLQLFYDEKTFSIIMTYEGCMWCAEAKPVFEAVTALYPYSAYSLNFTEVYKLEADTYKTDYDILTKIIDEVLTEEEDGERVLYVPEVIFVKDGKIVAHHCSTVDSHDPYEAPMTSEETNQLIDIYEEGYDLMK